MPRQFKNARLMKHLKVADAMKLLGVSQPTLARWKHHSILCHRRTLYDSTYFFRTRNGVRTTPNPTTDACEGGNVGRTPLF